MTDTKERDAIISAEAQWVLGGLDPVPQADYSVGGPCHFDGLKPDTIQKLMDKGFLDPEENQNGSPTTREFLAWLRDNPGFTASGYAVTPERDDCRITISAVQFKGPSTQEQKQRFREFAGGAAECDAIENGLWGWWD